MKKVFDAQQERIEMLVEKQIKASSNKLAKALVMGLERSLKAEWTTKIEFKFEDPKERSW